MSDDRFSDAKTLTGDRLKVAKRVQSEVEEKGALETSDLANNLYEEFENTYDTKDSFKRTLLYIRPIMEERGMVDCKRAPAKSSIKTWEWRVKDP